MKSRSTTLLAWAVTALLAAAAVLLLAPAVAIAATVPAIAIDPTTGPPLTTIKIVGSGFCGPPCAPVSISVGSLYVANAVAVAADGTFTTFVRIPGTVRPGPVDVVASQTGRDGNPVQARDTFTVTINQPAPTKYPPPSTIAPPGGLPVTPGGPTASAGAGTSGASPATEAPDTSTPAVRTDSGSSVAARPTSGNSGPGAWPWIVLAAVVTAGLAAGAWWGVRRRNRSDQDSAGG